MRGQRTGPAGRRRRAAIATAAAVAAAVAGGCGVPVQQSSTPITTGPVLAELVAPTTAPPPSIAPERPALPDSTAESLPVDVWFVREDRLVRSARRLPLPAQLVDLVAALREGPAAADRNQGVRSAVPPSEGLTTVVAGGVATVALSPDFAILPAADQVLAIGQVVRTLTSFPGVGQVAFTVDGQPIGVPRGDGTAAFGPVSGDDYTELTG